MPGYFKIAVLFFLLLPFTSRAQQKEQVMNYDAYNKASRTIQDSLALARKNLQDGNAAKADRTATALLKLYPLQLAYDTGLSSVVTKPYLTRLPDYPETIYALRARAREALGNYSAAEADITRAMRGLPGRYVTETAFSENIKTKEYYEIRARLRLNHLKNQAGACADLAVLYQLDTVRAGNPRWHGCSMPKVKFVTTEKEKWEAMTAAGDSLEKAKTALAQNRNAEALRLLTAIIEGRVGRFVKVVVHIEGGLLWGLRAKARVGLHDYKKAEADLDTAITYQSRCNTAGDGRWRYQRGRLRIEHLQNREGGCTDLAEAYRCDTTVTAASHSRWLGCNLPVYKRAISKEEEQEAHQAFAAAMKLGDSLLAKMQFDQVLSLSTGLIKGHAGRFELIGLPGYGTYEYVQARTLRSAALEGLHRYREALADLDTTLLFARHAPGIGWVYCNRGILKLDKLNDTTGCADLRQCYLLGFKPKDRNWRGCTFKERTTQYHIADRFLHPVFDELTETSPRVGLFYQGRPGLEAGILLSRNDWLANWGPSLGLDIMPGYKSGWPVVAPKLAFEGQALFAAGRIDFTYFGYQGQRDLRFTPQLGVSLLAVVNLLYGYSIPLLADEQPFLTRHRLSLYINFVKMSKIGG